jgi:pyruvate,water dikinase
MNPHPWGAGSARAVHGGAIPLVDALDESRFGGKAVQLGSALRAGLPVPEGVALPVELVDAVAAGSEEAAQGCLSAFDMVRGEAVAVRSSAVGEDAAHTSFAGQHLTRLNVTEAAILEAVTDVWRSGRSESALAYRARLGVEGAPRVAVVVQEMVAPECAGVLFTRNPVDGSDERVIEAAWGLGEVVVAGLVEPDRFHLARGGAVKEAVVGYKDVRMRMLPGGDTEEVPVDAHLRSAPCLADPQLEMLEALASRCEALFPGAHDIEWAFSGGRLYLLQRRSITR